jgi:monovalent cation:H+ antiporter-2, CPA2 family
MHHDLTLFATITMAILTAFIGGFAARKLGLPALVGYLFAGLAIGPFTPGFVGDMNAISQLAEMGVIFILFGVGLHFSLKDLWEVRRIAIPGAALRTTMAALIGFLLTQLWGWSSGAGFVLGLAISVASTVVLLRGLSDYGLLNTVHGKVAVGWLVFEDIVTVAILVLLPALVGDSGNLIETFGLALLKTGLFIAIMLFVGTRLMPWLLTQIARTRSRELFTLAVVTAAIGTAFAAAELFDVSLALAAFLAGVVISESDVSHQVGAEIVPFRDVFAVLFFVSVGMLVDPAVVRAEVWHVLELTALIVIGKNMITLLLGFVLPASERTLIVVAASSSQIGEFSFIVGQMGVSLDLLTQNQYGLILAASVLSIVVNPFMFRAILPTEHVLQRVPTLWQRLERGGPTPELLNKAMTDHVVIVGYGRVGRHIGRVLDHLGSPYLIIEMDAAYASDMQRAGIQTLFGDATNTEILRYSGLDQACALVVTVPDEVTAELIVAAAHDLAPTLPIIARAGTASGVERLVTHGARHVIHPELEGGLEMVRHTLLTLGYPMGQIQPYVDAVRRDAYQARVQDDQQHPVLDQLLAAVRGVEIVWYAIEENSPLVGKSLAEANIRARTGASVIVVMREYTVIPNPKSNMPFAEGDMVGLIGTVQEIEAAAHLFGPAHSH